MYRKIDAREMCVKFNEVREQNLNNDLTRDEIVARLRPIFSDRQIRGLVANGVIQAAPGRKYRFLSTPLLWVKLERILNECRERRTRCVSEELTVQSAIDLLKREGYKVLRPRTEYDEI